jgi:hypothetical protein
VRLEKPFNFGYVDAVDMKRIILIALCLMCSIGTASAYQLYLSCPESVQVGIPLKCTVDTNLPAGTTFEVAFYQSGYTATPISRSSLTVQDHALNMAAPTMYQLFDTKGLPGGQYKVEVQFTGTQGGSLSDDSVTWQLPKVLDRSGDITMTSPMSQTLEEALRIEGSILKLGNAGVEIEVRGPDGRIFGPQYIGSKNDLRSGAGVFTQKVTVTKPGEYDVYFSDSQGYIGIKTFTVSAPVTASPTTVPTTAVITTLPLTTVPTTIPTTTQSPLSPIPVAAALAVVGLLMATMAKKR